MLAFQTISAIVLLAVLHICLSYPSIRTRGAAVRHECSDGCGNDCDSCVYGVVISSVCGVPECRKGPNERCGGLDNVKGVCGEGMRCQCNRCIGCSVETFKCADEIFNEPCRPRDAGMDGYWDPLHSNRFIH